MNEYLHLTLMAGVSQVATGMFVATPKIFRPLTSVSTTNEVLQVNDGTSETEAVTE